MNRRRTLGLARATRRAPESPLSPRAAAFVRGLTVGALAGAALVGSAIFGARRRARPMPAPGAPSPDERPAERPSG